MATQKAASVAAFSFILFIGLVLVCLVCFTSLSFDCHTNGYDAHRSEAKEKKSALPELTLRQPDAGDLPEAVFEIMVGCVPHTLFVLPHAQRRQVRLAVKEGLIGES
jgi:hypothetical protein